MLAVLTREQAIGKSTRNTIKGDSVTNFPVLSYTTTNFVDQDTPVSPILSEQCFCLRSNCQGLVSTECVWLGRTVCGTLYVTAVANDVGGAERGFGCPPENLARLVLYCGNVCRYRDRRHLHRVVSVQLDVRVRYDLTETTQRGRMLVVPRLSRTIQ